VDSRTGLHFSPNMRKSRKVPADTEASPVVGAYAKAERFVDSLLPRDGVLRVLDIKAGEERFEIRRPIYAVSVDVLQAERGHRPDADEHRTMDLDEVEIESETYDIVLCNNVLEHARDPLALLPVMRDALKTGGILVTVFPNVVSLKSLVVRLAPARVQRWFYTRVLRTGPGSDPARAVHSFSLRRSSLLRHARSEGWKVEYFSAYEGPVQKSVRHRIGLVGPPWRFFVVMTRVLTLGLLTAEETGIVAVFRKISSESL
jgi:SAM-dependent methyltransferase